jgi:hypothetical protein
MDKDTQQLLIFLGEEGFKRLIKWYKLKKTKGEDLDKLLEEAASDNNLSIDQIN